MVSVTNFTEFKFIGIEISENPKEASAQKTERKGAQETYQG